MTGWYTPKSTKHDSFLRRTLLSASGSSGWRTDDAAYALWEASEGIGLSAADARENIESFLSQNSGAQLRCPFRRWHPGGRAACKRDGRRGFLYHCAVAKSHRRRGIGKALVERSLAALAARGMRKCHIFVAAYNAEGKRFWQRIGWEERTTILVMSHDVATFAAGSGKGRHGA